MKITKNQLRQIIFETVTNFAELPVGSVDGRVPEINIGHDAALSRKTIKKNMKSHVGETPFELLPHAVSQMTDFGYVRDAEKNLTHQGLDIFGRIGAPVQAVINAFVHFAGFESGKGGNVVVLATKDPISGEDSSTWRYEVGKTDFIRYAHLETVEPQIVGQRVNAGQLIGTLGATGTTAHEFTLSDGGVGGHIHLSIYGTKKNGEPHYSGPQRDPADYMTNVIEKLEAESELEYDDKVARIGAEGDYESALRAAGASEEEIQRMQQNQEKYYEMLRNQAEEIEKYNR